MCPNHPYRRVASIAVALLWAIAELCAQEATWKYVETPENCAFYECEFVDDSSMICISDSCGVYRLSAPTWQAEKLTVDSSDWRFVPRSIARSIDGAVHIVGHRTTWHISLKSRELVPMHFTSTDRGATWNIVAHPEAQYGKYQSMRCSRTDNSCVIGYDRFVPVAEDDHLVDTHQLVINVYENADLRSSIAVLSRSTLPYVPSRECPGGAHQDEWTFDLTYDGTGGIAFDVVFRCDLGYMSHEPRYSQSKYYSSDRGKTFPVAVHSIGPNYGQRDYVRYRYLTPNYLASDFWTDGSILSRDQGKSWNRELTAVSGTSDSVKPGLLQPAIMRGRTAVGSRFAGFLDSERRMFVYEFGVFNLDFGAFMVEHRDTLVNGPRLARASARGYAVVPLGSNGLYVRTPRQLSSVDRIRESSVMIHPNPATNTITLTGLLDGEEIVLYSLYGERLLSTTTTDSNHLLDVSHLASGSYGVSVGHGRAFSKLVIVR